MVSQLYIYLLISYTFGLIIALQPVKLGILLPANINYPFSIGKVVPAQKRRQSKLTAIDIAIDTVRKTNLLPNHSLIKRVRDSKCSETIGPLEAIDLYVKKEVNVYLGPVCDYAVAPISRFAPWWSIPVISAGAFVKAFDDKKEYKTLRRIQGPYGKNAEFVWEVTRTFNWTRIGLIFNDNHKPLLGRTDHYFTLEPIYHMFKEYGLEPWYKAFDEKYPLTFDYGELLMEASTAARSKIFFTF